MKRLSNRANLYNNASLIIHYTDHQFNKIKLFYKKNVSQKLDNNMDKNSPHGQEFTRLLTVDGSIVWDDRNAGM